MPDLLSPSVAAEWISRLLKQWTTLRRARTHELQEIQNTFGDPELLARFYVQPNCQQVNPADHNEDEAGRAVTEPIFGWLSHFLKGRFFERDGRNVVFILSDAGMGKSSLLMMLKLFHLVRFWPDGLDFRLLKLGPDTLEQLTTIQNRSATVLLLDSLDEDPLAWGRVEERLLELLSEAVNFRQVIVTCRTQFFPEGGGAPIEAPHKIVIGGYTCNLLYLSPFSDEQVDLYLRKIYPNRWGHRLLKLWTKRDNPQLSRSRDFIKRMGSLRMRPMLLAHVDDLMRAGLQQWTEFSVYNALVRAWILREIRKQPGYSETQLWRVCEEVAMFLQAEGRRTLSLDDLDKIRSYLPAVKSLETFDIGGRSLLNRTSEKGFRFSHYSIQEFLVARCFLNNTHRRDGKIRVTSLLMRFVISWVEWAELPEIPAKLWIRLNPEESSARDRALHRVLMYEVFVDERLIYNGAVFISCKFQSCHILHEGCIFVDCSFVDCSLSFHPSSFRDCVRRSGEDKSWTRFNSLKRLSDI